MVGCTGDDDFGRTLREALRAEGIDDSQVRIVAGAPTGIAMITVDRAGENMITVAPGANHEVSTADITAAQLGWSQPAPSGPDAADSAAPVSGAANGFRDVLVISAEVPIPVITAALAESAGRALRVLNLAPAPSRAAAAELVAAGPEWLVVNESEAAAVLGRTVAGLAEAADAAADLVAAGARNAVVTAGAAGAAYCGPQSGADARSPAANHRGRGRPPARRQPPRGRNGPGFQGHRRRHRGRGRHVRRRARGRPRGRRSRRPTRSPPPPRLAPPRPPGRAPNRACPARPTSSP